MRKPVIAALLAGGLAAIVMMVGVRPGDAIPAEPLFASLDGRNEVGPDGKKGAGDPDGAGAFSAIIDGDQLCFGLSVRDIGDPFAAHIHRGNPFGCRSGGGAPHPSGGG